MPRKRTGTLIYKPTVGWCARVWRGEPPNTTRAWVRFETHDKALAQERLRELIANPHPVPFSLAGYAHRPDPSKRFVLRESAKTPEVTPVLTFQEAVVRLDTIGDKNLGIFLAESGVKPALTPDEDEATCGKVDPDQQLPGADGDPREGREGS